MKLIGRQKPETQIYLYPTVWSCSKKHLPLNRKILRPLTISASSIVFKALMETPITKNRRKKPCNGMPAPLNQIPMLVIAICGAECALIGWGVPRNQSSFYDKAESLDPNGYFTVALIGWHYVQISDYPAAYEWFQRSLELESGKDNLIAASYSDIVFNKLIQNASGNNLLPPGF